MSNRAFRKLYLEKQSKKQPKDEEEDEEEDGTLQCSCIDACVCSCRAFVFAFAFVHEVRGLHAHALRGASASNFALQRLQPQNPQEMPLIWYVTARLSCTYTHSLHLLTFASFRSKLAMGEDGEEDVDTEGVVEDWMEGEAPTTPAAATSTQSRFVARVYLGLLF